MSLRTTVLLLAICAATAAAASKLDEGLDSVYGMQSLSLACDTDAKVLSILGHQNERGFDFLRIPRSRDEPVEVLVTADKLPGFKRELLGLGVDFQVRAEDVAKVIRREMREQRAARRRRRRMAVGSISFDHYPRYEEIKSYLELLGKTRGDVIKPFSLGKSYEGRDILAVKFTSGGEYKPALLIDAGIHPREWVAPTTALYAIKQLAENASYQYLYRDIDIYIVPLLNPDGYEYTHLNESTRLWRKTRSDIPNSTCKGVDANRNFELEWMSVGASNIPCTATYAGYRPFSEPETRALRDFILARRDRIRTYLSFHSFGNYILHPWGFTHELPPNEPILRCAAVAAEAELSKVRGTRYKIGSSTNVLYPAAGGSDDWTMGTAGVELTYTIELPGGIYGFSPPTSEIEPIGHETFELVKVFAGYVRGDVCNPRAHL